MSDDRGSARPAYERHHRRFQEKAGRLRSRGLEDEAEEEEEDLLFLESLDLEDTAAAEFLEAVAGLEQNLNKANERR